MRWGRGVSKSMLRKIVNRIALFVTTRTSKSVHNFPTPLESTPSPFKFARHIRS